MLATYDATGPSAAPPSTNKGPSTSSHMTLVVNRDYTPLGFPLSIVGAEGAVALVVSGRAEPVRMSGCVMTSAGFQGSNGANWPTRPAERQEVRLPSVIRWREMVPTPMLNGRAALTRYNLFLRDEGRDLYSNAELELSTRDLTRLATVDHVLPRSRGGQNRWENWATQSAADNNAKGNLTPEEAGLELQGDLWVPTGADLLRRWQMLERMWSVFPTDWLEFLMRRPTPVQVAAIQKRTAK